MGNSLTTVKKNIKIVCLTAKIITAMIVTKSIFIKIILTKMKKCIEKILYSNPTELCVLAQTQQRLHKCSNIQKSLANKYHSI
jgi:hypothetical protein